MKIIDIDVELKHFKLIKSYKIANRTIDKVANCIVKLTLENGLIGLGAGAPIEFVTGESMDMCIQALEASTKSDLFNLSIYSLPAIIKKLRTQLGSTPAACAALDIAIHDAYAKLAKMPLVDVMGRVHKSLPTSITIGIKDLESALKEALDYVQQGFTHLKIKLGESVEEDIALMHYLREKLPQNIHIRVDMNQGYSFPELMLFLEKTKSLNLELIEQPLSKEQVHHLAQLPQEVKNKIALDENLIKPQDAFQLVCPEKLAGIFNIKLMKCGGIAGALHIAQIASYAKCALMWGCMDESRISITAALHAALASSQSAYLDLDGSFDIADDVVDAGFVLEKGCLSTLEKPGLGVEVL